MISLQGEGGGRGDKLTMTSPPGEIADKKGGTRLTPDSRLRTPD